MMIVRISDTERRAWLDCEFCSKTYEYPFQASILWKGDAVRETSLPTLRSAIRAHYYLDEHGSFNFAPCPKKHDWHDTQATLVDADSGQPLQSARMRFEQTEHGETLEVS